ncbi:MAG: acetolactate synthase 3 large subunit, partial [Alphaproteobacteria bacterium PA3]
AIELIANAKAPIFYTGGGVINSGPEASRLLRQLQDMTGAPVTSTLMGLGAFPSRHPDWLGMLGMHGTYEANMAMNKADVMVCIGARFDDRVTGRLDAFSPSSTKIHIDIDRSSINKVVPVDLAIVGDCGTVLAQMIAAWGGRQARNLGEWKARIAGWRARECLAYPERSPKNPGMIMPQKAVERLHALTHQRNPIITTEVGQHQMWAAQYFGFEDPNKWLTSGG